MQVAPGATFEAVIDWGATGATLGLRIIDNAGATTVARLATNITEYPAGSGIYSRTGNTAPSVGGQYTLVWDDDAGVGAVGHVATEDLLVTSTTAYTAPSGTDYISSSDLKTRLGITVTTYDTRAAGAVAAASRGVDGACDRRFWADADATSVRYYSPAPTSQICAIDDLVTLGSVKTDTGNDGTFATTLTSGTDYDLWPLNAAAENPVRPYTVVRLRGSGSWPYYSRSVKVTGKFGWPAVPAGVVEATAILATIIFKRTDTPFGIFTAGVDEVTAMRIAQTDPTIRGLLAPFIRLQT
jgi:hypothetical protein